MSRALRGEGKTLSDLFRKYSKEIDYCTFCPKMCRFSCPVANVTHNETFTPWGRQTILYLAREGQIPFNREVAFTMYQCVGCMLCREYCDYLVEIPPVMIAAREKGVAERIAPHEVIEFRNFFAQQNNPFGDNLRARVKTLVPEVYFNTEAQVAYFAGCAEIYHFPQIVQDTFRVFEAMEIDYRGRDHVLRHGAQGAWASKGVRGQRPETGEGPLAL